MEGIADTQGGLLVVVLDTNPSSWINEKEFSLKHAIESVLLYVNAYLLQHRNNRLVILGAHAGKSVFLFPDPEGKNRTGTAEQFSSVKEQVWKNIIELSKIPIDEANSKTSLSAGLSLALCFINRSMNESRDLRPRILVVDSSLDAAEQYISIMNCIFSAQKKQIPIDSCVLASEPSSFLQQASYLTGGIYFKPNDPQGLVQYFLTIWLADTETRQMLKLPTQASVDFRAMCFCHKQTISTAFVCPVCLSLFCQFSPVCSTCGIRSHIKPPKVKRSIQDIREKPSPVTAVVIGAGQRGRTYAEYAKERPDLFQIIGVAEPREFWRQYMTTTYGIPEENVFKDWNDAAKKRKFADCVIIATQDAMHADPAIAFAKLGYHILLEKPMAVTKEDCIRIHTAVKENNVLLSVCHVMRCSPYSLKLRELTRTLGCVVNIQHIEPVGYWHQVHSYVRGNWRNQVSSTFMLMAKSCHDIDYIHFLMEKSPRAVSSFGSLVHFRAEQKPPTASERCMDCPVESSCAYSAKKIYLEVSPPTVSLNSTSDNVVTRPSHVAWYKGERSATSGYNDWPLSVLHEKPTVESITEALLVGPYGRCVYACDNDVVDNQVVNFQFEDGATASFTMVAFTEATCVRTTRVFGTKGEIMADGHSIRYFDFSTRLVHEYFPSSSTSTRLRGHGGADYFLIENFVQGVRLNDPTVLLTGADESLKSHLMVFAAEEARLSDSVVRF